jgi:excisionase family DNA binding protein
MIKSKEQNNLQTYTVNDVANFLQISPRTVYVHIERNALKGIKIGNKWRFTESQVRDYIQKLERKAVISSDE